MILIYSALGRHEKWATLTPAVIPSIGLTSNINDTLPNGRLQVVTNVQKAHFEGSYYMYVPHYEYDILLDKEM